MLLWPQIIWNIQINFLKFLVPTNNIYQRQGRVSWSPEFSVLILGSDFGLVWWGEVLHLSGPNSTCQGEKGFACFFHYMHTIIVNTGMLHTVRLLLAPVVPSKTCWESHVWMETLTGMNICQGGGAELIPYKSRFTHFSEASLLTQWYFIRVCHPTLNFTGLDCIK